MRELDPYYDRHLFSDMNTTKIWPVYGGKSFDLWQPDTGEYFARAESGKAIKHLQEKRKNQVNTPKSAFFGMQKVWFDTVKTLPCLSPRVAFRTITHFRNARTTIACLIPPNVFLTGSAPYLFLGHKFQKPKLQQSEAFHLGVMSSVPFDWYTRRVIELSFTFTIFNECPFPQPSEDDPLRLRVVELAGRLAAVDERYAEWAEAVGVPVASANDDPVKSKLIAELDAAVALLYGLDKDDLEKIWETFHPKTDHLSKLNEVLGHHKNLQG